MRRYLSAEEVTAGLIELDQATVVNGADENDGPPEEESDSFSDSGSVDPDGQPEEEEFSEEKSNSGSISSSSEDESDEDYRVRQLGAPLVDPAEAAEFDRELKTLMQESLESRKLEVRARPTLNMMIPMNNLEGESGEETGEEEGKVKVRVLVKKGHKQQTKQMLIPGDCSLIQGTKQKEAEELEEKLNIKRRILEYNEREEEEANGAVSGGWGMGGRGAGRGGWEAGRGGQRYRLVQGSGGGASYGYSRKR